VFTAPHGALHDGARFAILLHELRDTRSRTRSRARAASRRRNTRRSVATNDGTRCLTGRFPLHEVRALDKELLCAPS